MRDPVSYSVAEALELVKVGEFFEVTAKATINNDADPYSRQFSSTNPEMTVTGDLQDSEPVTEMDLNFIEELGWHSKEATFTIPLTFQPHYQSVLCV